jgi:glutathione S-transferase
MTERPSWYTQSVNPSGKVPALAYTDAQYPPGPPPPDAPKLTESLVMIDFVNNIDPEHRLLPKDPLETARVRFFIETFSTYFMPVWNNVLFKGEDANGLLKSVDVVQSLLSPNAEFAVGNQYTLADIAVLPFLARMELCLKNDLGAYPEGTGPKIYDILANDEKYSLYRRYLSTLKSRDSFRATFDEEYLVNIFATKLKEIRAAAKEKAAPV